MKRRAFNTYLGVAAAASTLSAKAVAHAEHDANGWNFVADVAEACSCEIPCPCNFGRRTKLKCEGSRLIKITKGSIAGADLAGIAFVVTFDMGNWTRMYMDEAMSPAQRAAFDQLFPLAFGGFKKLMKSFEYVPLMHERDNNTVRFSVPDSKVEIALMRGLNDQPITVDNLPSPAFHNYTQYESVVHTHKSDGGEYTHQGTNGFTSTMIVKGTV